MPNITSFEILDDEIKRIGGKPAVLEALWDGDTEGWYLLLYLYTKREGFFNRRQTRHLLGEVCISKGMEHFTDGKWTVAELANSFGKKAKEKYKLTFYFPSQEPDNDCPKWTERYLAIHCADCNKLIIPTDSPYLPKDICYSCHLTKEQNERVKNAEPCDDGVSMYLFKNDEYERIGYSTNFQSMTIAPFIAGKVNEQLTSEAISIVTLNKEDVLELKQKLETILEEKLLEYEKPIIEEKRKRLIATHMVQFKGQEYELMYQFNDNHSEISGLVSSFNDASRAIAEGYTYQLFFKKGITYRDDSVLRFVNYVCEGTTTVSAIREQYRKVLTENEVLDTVKKLALIGCVTVSGNEIAITVIGKNIV